MSRLTNLLSPNAIKAMFSSETDDQVIMLLTIYDPTQPDVPVRLADGFTDRLAAYTTDREIIYGVTSRSHDYLFMPMQVTLPAEQETGVGQCSVTFNFVAPESIELIRSHLSRPTKVLLELVLASNPDYVEAKFPGFYITSATYNAESITLQLSMVSLVREPFPSFNFTPKYFPGLF